MGDEGIWFTATRDRGSDHLSRPREALGCTATNKPKYISMLNTGRLNWPAPVG
ncbi:hypothetical protein LIA77_08510 [Sarocladium implicatum]|nr:hypothetical protein LIA77_08510 [Sarocladium implicatum]